ncbi:MAG: ATP-binding protein [Lachnospiraceae bacterium]|nr:ATP-binding protein [Lachnospiraceae bacterium]
MKSITIEAKTDNLPEVLSFVDAILEENDCPVKAQMQIDIAVEEIFVNIANYAYEPGSGNADINAEVSGETPEFIISFADRGTPYNPLEKADPDITLSLEKRPIGGLGIFMVKKSMDKVEYEYKDGQNILTIHKTL